MTLVGSKILHYRILQEIGAGGMGIVYLAEDEKLHRRVALKFLAKSIQDDPDARDRLIREARAASALNHPNIVAIHAIETTPEAVFIVMEYVEGESIHKLVKAGQMTWQRAIDLAPQVLSALATAHDAGIVHRDIKSDNILLTPKGQIKVLDFGLARGRDATLLASRIGSSAGTPAYMSPEQVQGGEITERSDLFSFGVVLYEMLTGRFPVQGRARSRAHLLDRQRNADGDPYPQQVGAARAREHRDQAARKEPEGSLPERAGSHGRPAALGGGREGQGPPAAPGAHVRRLDRRRVDPAARVS